MGASAFYRGALFVLSSADFFIEKFKIVPDSSMESPHFRCDNMPLLPSGFNWDNVL